MAFTFVASRTGTTDYGPYKTVSTSGGTLNVAASDLIVVYGIWGEAASGGATISDSGSNSCTMEDEINYGGTCYLRCGYKLSAVANATATFALTTINNVYLLRIIALQFRPDSGDVVTKDQNQATGTGYGTTPLTGNITTTGDDEVTTCGESLNYGPNPTAEKIGGIAADGVVDASTDGASAWYRILNATASSINGQATLGGNYDWAILLNSFKATATGGGAAIEIQTIG
jgi:hypothetical protein